MDLWSQATQLKRQRWQAAACLIGLFLGGCATTTALKWTEAVKRPESEIRVLLMDPDIELSEMTAAGLLEPRADWTADAKKHVTTALTEELKSKRAALILYKPPRDDATKEKSYKQLVKLYEAVGGTILVHKYNPNLALPTKEDKFDWTLGEAVNPLQADQDADYTIFVWIRDSYASAGRVAAIIGAALLGVSIPGGNQMAFASLVNLSTGDVVWFNRLIDPTGDLRTPEAASRAVKSLLRDFPL